MQRCPCHLFSSSTELKWVLDKCGAWPPPQSVPWSLQGPASPRLGYLSPPWPWQVNIQQLCKCSTVLQRMSPQPARAVGSPMHCYHLWGPFLPANSSLCLQTFYSAIIDLCDNGGKRPPSSMGIGFTKEQADAIRRIRNSKDSWDMLGVKPGATR